MKILIITYYWPPSGGAGVQRWLKLSKYLSRLGVDVHVLTVDEEYASYMQLDHSLSKDIEAGVKVTKTKSFEPINWYARLVGKKNVPTAGFSNVDNNKWSQKMVNFLRTNLFIPDPRKYWKKYAVSAATKIITEQGIDVVVTTSPPHSTQLIGLELKRKLGVKWVADFRDPWTDIYYYNEIGHTSYSRRKDAECEKEVLLECDKIITVSNQIEDVLVKKVSQMAKDKWVVIPNGFDREDFAGLKKTPNELFTITYTGTMSSIYQPEVFFNCLSDVLKSSKKEALLQFVGQIDNEILRKIEGQSLNYEYFPTVPHDQIIQYQINADLLLLVIPKSEYDKGIVTGKIFEYLASGNPIVGIGPEDGDAAEILKRSGSGAMYDRGSLGRIKATLKDAMFKKPKGGVKEEVVLEYSRDEQAKKYWKTLNDEKAIAK